MIKRRVELELADLGASSEEIAQRVAAARCAMCLEAESQEARRKRPRPTPPVSTGTATRH